MESLDLYWSGWELFRKSYKALELLARISFLRNAQCWKLNRSSYNNVRIIFNPYTVITNDSLGRITNSMKRLKYRLRNVTRKYIDSEVNSVEFVPNLGPDAWKFFWKVSTRLKWQYFWSFHSIIMNGTMVL